MEERDLPASEGANCQEETSGERRNRGTGRTEPPHRCYRVRLLRGILTNQPAHPVDCEAFQGGVHPQEDSQSCVVEDVSCAKVEVLEGGEGWRVKGGDWEVGKCWQEVSTGEAEDERLELASERGLSEGGEASELVEHNRLGKLHLLGLERAFAIPPAGRNDDLVELYLVELVVQSEIMQPEGKRLGPDGAVRRRKVLREGKALEPWCGGGREAAKRFDAGVEVETAHKAVVGALGDVGVEAEGELLEVLPAAGGCEGFGGKEVVEVVGSDGGTDSEGDRPRRGEREEEIDEELWVVAMERVCEQWGRGKWRKRKRRTATPRFSPS